QAGADDPPPSVGQGAPRRDVGVLRGTIVARDDFKRGGRTRELGPLADELGPGVGPAAGRAGRTTLVGPVDVLVGRLANRHRDAWGPRDTYGPGPATDVCVS